jgi:hypothetical protein
VGGGDVPQEKDILSKSLYPNVMIQKYCGLGSCSNICQHCFWRWLSYSCVAWGAVCTCVWWSCSWPGGAVTEAGRAVSVVCRVIPVTIPVTVPVACVACSWQPWAVPAGIGVGPATVCFSFPVTGGYVSGAVWALANSCLFTVWAIPTAVHAVPVASWDVAIQGLTVTTAVGPVPALYNRG